MDLANRVTRLEVTVEAQGKEIGILKQTGEILKKSLEGVERTLLQIKWMALGAFGMYVASTLGIIKAVKTMFGIG